MLSTDKERITAFFDRPRHPISADVHVRTALNNAMQGVLIRSAIGRPHPDSWKPTRSLELATVCRIKANRVPKYFDCFPGFGYDYRRMAAGVACRVATRAAALCYNAITRADLSIVQGGTPMIRIHRTFWQKCIYRKIYKCRRCRLGLCRKCETAGSIRVLISPRATRRGGRRIKSIVFP